MRRCTPLDLPYSLYFCCTKDGLGITKSPKQSDFRAKVHGRHRCPVRLHQRIVVNVNFMSFEFCSVYRHLNELKAGAPGICTQTIFDLCEFRLALNAWLSEIPLTSVIYKAFVSRDIGFKQIRWTCSHKRQIFKEDMARRRSCSGTLRCCAKMRSRVTCAELSIDDKRQYRIHGCLSTVRRTAAGRAGTRGQNSNHGR